MKIVDEPVFEQFSTKKALKFLDSCGWKRKNYTCFRIRTKTLSFEIFANIKVSISAQKEINAESVLGTSTIILTKAALKDLEQRLG